MRRVIACLFFIVGLALRASAVDVASLSGTAGIPPLLLDALTKIAEDFDRWAFTESQKSVDDQGKVRTETVVRFDPSKPYEEQFTPLLIKGKPPTEKQLKDYRKRGVQRGERFAKQEAEGKVPGTELPKFNVNGGTASIDLAHATIVSEDAATVTYEVPFRNDGKATLPVEKFQLLARVDKERHAFENVALRLRGAFRVKLLVKVKSGEASFDFAPVDSTHNPTLIGMSGDGTATVLFMKFGASFELKRTEFKRVTPYGERFGVKIGPLKALDF